MSGGSQLVHWQPDGGLGPTQPFLVKGLSSNEPFGSRPEPGVCLIASILLLPPGEVPKGRVRVHQDTAAQVLSESEACGPCLKPALPD